MSNLTVLDFTGGNLRDLPKCLRNIADAIENGEHGEAKAMALVLETTDGFETFGIGDADQLRCLGLLHMGIATLSSAEIE
jgi:hypothetical protein